MIRYILHSMSSLQLTWWVLLGIVAWFSLGIQAAAYDFFAEGLTTMNAVLVRDWLIYQALQKPWVLSWLIVLILLSVILALNLIFCLWKKLAGEVSAGQGVRFWFFLGLHLLFGLVMIMHGLEMVLGEKQPWQRVQAGSTISLDSGWRARVHKLQFMHDVQVLQMERSERRKLMTIESFDLEANYVRVSLLHKGQLVKTENIGMLSPLVQDNIHVVLRKFEFGPQGLSARIRMVEAPLHKAFFSVYAVFILSLLIWLIIRICQTK